MVLDADSLCIDRFFSCLLRIFPVIYSWAFVHQSSMFRVVDVLCAVSYIVAEDEWIFPLCYGFFFCVSWSTPCSSLVKKRKIRAITVFKVIQGHRGRYQSKAPMRFPISD